jgi:kynurenine formamidase
MRARLVDLSHVIEPGMQTYPGLPGPMICDYLTRDESRTRFAGGTTFQIGRIDMVANTGTYIDVPFHRYEEGADLAKVALKQLADLPLVVVAPRLVGGARAIGPEAFDGLNLAGKAILFNTGWSRHWRAPAYNRQNPFVTREAARILVSQGAVFVGIDSVNIDDLDDLTRPAHSILLGAGIAIGEHFTNLAGLPGDGARLHAVPPKVAGMGTFPVRAYALVPEK